MTSVGLNNITQSNCREEHKAQSINDESTCNKHRDSSDVSDIATGAEKISL